MPHARSRTLAVTALVLAVLWLVTPQYPGLRFPVTLAVGLTALVVVLRRPERRLSWPVAEVVLWTFLAWELVSSFVPLTFRIGRAPVAVAGLLGLLAVLALLCVLCPRSRRRTTAFAVLLATYAGLMLWMFQAFEPVIDIPLYLREGVRQVATGHSPYAGSIRDLFPPAASHVLYGPGLVSHGRVLAGYTYLPATFAVDAAGLVLLGDERIAHLAAVVAVAVLLWRRTEGRLGRLAVVLLLVQRYTTVGLAGHYNDADLLLFFVLVLDGLHSRCRLSFVAGLVATLLSKQYVVVLLPLARSLRGAVPVRWVVVAVALAVVVLAAFVAWDPGHFLRSAVLFHQRQPVRHNLLSLTVALSDAGVAVPTWVMGVGALLAGVLVAVLLGRPDSSAARLALCAGAALLIFVLLSKQGQLNYYWLGASLLLCGVALSGSPPRPQEDAETTPLEAGVGARRVSA